MTITRRSILALLLLATLLGVACNPLDPSKIESQKDGAATAGCAPACTASQHCLKTSTGACSCFEGCDNSQCQAGSCVMDPSQGAVCVDLAQTRCP